MRTRALLSLLLLSPGSLAFADAKTDRKTEEAASSSYNFRTVLNNQVTVTVEDGIVTLAGTVLDRDQKALAEDTVRSLPGVTEVRNHLDVSAPGQERSDGWIALKIRSILLLRANVSAGNTDVTVRDGIVTLAGVAETPLQKELTESYARDVQGVRAVRNLMKVRDEERASTASPPVALPAEKADDGSITAQVRHAVLAHNAVRNLDPKIHAEDGAVVIRGTAASIAERDLVTELARQIRGVVSVSNEMEVSATE